MSEPPTQPPDDVPPCEATLRAQAPPPAAGPGRFTVGPWTTYYCTRAAGDHENHYHPEVGWWRDETDEEPF